MSGGLIKETPCTKCGSSMHAADEGKCGPVIKWCIVVPGDSDPARADDPAEFVEVEDVMRCIDKPGDFGWVARINGGGRWIADYHQVFPTRADARTAWIKTQLERIARATKELEAMRANDANPIDIMRDPALARRFVAALGLELAELQCPCGMPNGGHERWCSHNPCEMSEP